MTNIFPSAYHNYNCSTEAWGVLVRGKNARRQLGLDMLAWVNLPGRATIVPAHRRDVLRTQDIAARLGVDCVDVMLVELADDITATCGLRDPLLIATFDTGDFTRMFQEKGGMHFRIFDMRSLEIVAFY